MTELSNAEMLNECLKSTTNTEWEQEFLGSLKTALDSGRFLSDKQTKILHRIFSKGLNQEEVSKSKEMVGKCLEKSELIGEWDADFLDSIGSVLERGYTLSAKQSSNLKRIYTNLYKK